MKDTIPTVYDYTLYLNKAVSKFNITTEEARNLYGKFTYSQWELLLNN